MEKFVEYFKNSNLFSHIKFRLPCEIFLYLCIICAKFEDEETMTYFDKVIEFATDIKETNASSEQESSNTISLSVNKAMIKNLQEVDEMEVHKKNSLILEKNKLFAANFFIDLIRKVEFIIKNSENKPINKILYFFMDPVSYKISNESLEYFMQTVDRTSSTNKLKSLIKQVDLFKSEIEFHDMKFKSGGENKIANKVRLKIQYIN